MLVHFQVHGVKKVKTRSPSECPTLVDNLKCQQKRQNDIKVYKRSYKILLKNKLITFLNKKKLLRTLPVYFAISLSATSGHLLLWLK